MGSLSSQLEKQPGSQTPEPAHALSKAHEAAIERMLTSPYFARAPLLSALLRFIWIRSLDSSLPRVTEQEIGVKVFGRERGYDPGEDNIVRNYARQLRKRLEDYYTHEDTKTPFRLEVPRGGYVPVFVERPLDGVSEPLPNLLAASTPSPDNPAGTTVSSGVRGYPQHRVWFWIALALVLIFLLAVALLRSSGRGTRHQTSSNTALILRSIFRAGQTTYLVPSDTSFVMLEEMKRRTFSLAEYEAWSDIRQSNDVFGDYLREHRYSCVLDMKTAVRFERRPEVDPDRLIIRSARDLKIEDLREANAILLGSVYSNPWVEVIEPRLNFHFVYDRSANRSWIENRRPQGNEQLTYGLSGPGDSYVHSTYAILALVSNLNGTGRVLLIEGLGEAGTEAAVDVLMEGDPLAGIVAAARRSDGELYNFEVLMQTTSLDAHASGTRIVAYRVIR